VTVKASIFSPSHLEVATLNPYRFAVQKRIGQLLPCRHQYPLKGWPRDIHPFGPFLLLQPFQVLEAYCLSLLHRKSNFIKDSQRHTDRLKVGNIR